MPLLLEVIVQTVEDARAAAEGGADRLEVVRHIRAGGLTPPAALIRNIQNVTALPLRVMVRGNAGFTTTPLELPGLRRAAADFASLGVDGLVIGFARDGEPALDDVARALEETPDVRVTFHRAFDTLLAPLAALTEIARIPQIDRILTSGGDGAVADRAARLREWSQRAGNLGVTIIAGGGVDEEALALFAASDSTSEVHVGRAARDGGDPEAPVSAARVRRLRGLLDAGLADRRTP